MIYILIALLYGIVPLYILLSIALLWGLYVAVQDEKKRKLEEETKQY